MFHSFLYKLPEGIIFQATSNQRFRWSFSNTLRSFHWGSFPFLPRRRSQQLFLLVYQQVATSLIDLPNLPIYPSSWSSYKLAQESHELPLRYRNWDHLKLQKLYLNFNDIPCTSKLHLETEILINRIPFFPADFSFPHQKQLQNISLGHFNSSTANSQGTIQHFNSSTAKVLQHQRRRHGGLVSNGRRRCGGTLLPGGIPWVRSRSHPGSWRKRSKKPVEDGKHMGQLWENGWWMDTYG